MELIPSLSGVGMNYDVWTNSLIATIDDFIIPFFTKFNVGAYVGACVVTVLGLWMLSWIKTR